jgi:hypothetical protein
MTTTDNPVTPLRIPARELRKGDVISMGTIDTAEPIAREHGDGYMSIKFETEIGEHGTAFPLNLEVTVLSRSNPTWNDVVTALTRLADMFEYGKSHMSLSQEDCAGMLRETLARLQPATSGGFDTYCAWCQQEWTKHVGGKPGVPGGPSTCPTSDGDQPECGEDGAHGGVCGQPVIDGVCPDHGEVGPPVES